MSNSRNSQAATDTTVGAEETLEGTVIDSDGTPIKTNRALAFFDRHRTWFLIAGAGTLGFVLHGFLGRPDDCAVTYDDLEELEEDITDPNE